MMWRVRKKQHSTLVTFGTVLLLAGCGGRSKKQSDAALINSKVVFDEHAKNALLSGISKRCATSSLFLQQLGELCIDIPIPLDIFDLTSVKPKGLAEQGEDVKLTGQGAGAQAQQNETVGVVGSDSFAHGVSSHDGGLGLVSTQAAAQVSFKSYKPVADLVSFYLSQMERFGWQFDADFQAGETLLLFRKPDKRAAVSVRAGKKFCFVVIFVS